MTLRGILISFSILTMAACVGQTKEEGIEIAQQGPLEAGFMAEYLMWGDQRIVDVLEKLSEDEFNQPFNELSGNIHSKTAHILSIYEFFFGILEHKPYPAFPSLDHLSKDELIAKWKETIDKWPRKISEIRDGLFALPPAKNQRVEVQHIYLDTFAHTIHHRGQLLTFIRLIGKNKDEVHPKDTNIDYLNFLFKNKPEFIHAPESE